MTQLTSGHRSSSICRQARPWQWAAPRWPWDVAPSRAEGHRPLYQDQKRRKGPLGLIALGVAETLSARSQEHGCLEPSGKSAQGAHVRTSNLPGSSRPGSCALWVPPPQHKGGSHTGPQSHGSPGTRDPAGMAPPRTPPARLKNLNSSFKTRAATWREAPPLLDPQGSAGFRDTPQKRLPGFELGGGLAAPFCPPGSWTGPRRGKNRS